MAKSELSVLSSQCLNRRIPDKQALIDEVAAWQDSQQPEPCEGELAVHHRTSSRQTEQAVPRIMSDSRH